MRDLLNDLTEGLSHPDPILRAQLQMKKPQAKRFYTEVSVAGSGDSFEIRLDGRPVKTPAKNLLSVPTRALADLLAAEWDAQEKIIDPIRMPVTRLVNTAIDGVAQDTQVVFDDIVKFAGNDLLCYRAGEPQELVARQSALWDPLLDWAAATLGARFILIEGIIHRPQPEAAITAYAAVLQKHHTALKLSCLHTITALTGSAILTLAFAEGRLTVAECWSLAHLEEDWTIEHWGSDDEADARRAARFIEMQAAADAFFALGAEDDAG